MPPLTNFVDSETVIEAAWANKVDQLVVSVFDEPGTDKQLARTALDVPGLNTENSFQNARAGSSGGPFLTLDRNSASPAALDNMGAVVFDGRNLSAAAIQYARIIAQIGSPIAGAEHGSLILQATTSGVNTTRFQITGSTGAGVFFGPFNVTGALTQAGDQVALLGTANTYTQNQTIRKATPFITIDYTGATDGVVRYLKDGATIKWDILCQGTSVDDFLITDGATTRFQIIRSTGAATYTGSFNVVGALTDDGIPVVTISGAQSVSDKTFPSPILSGTVTGTYTLGGTPTIASPIITGAITFDPITTWTPGLSFGGGTVGLTFLTRDGNVMEIGDLVVVTFNIVINAIGTSTGVAKLTGLPFTVRTHGSSLGFGGNLLWGGLANTKVHVALAADSGATTATFNGAAAATVTLSNLTHVDFQAGTNIAGTVVYFKS